MSNGDPGAKLHEEGPGGQAVGWRGVIPGAIVLVALSLACLYTLVALWPHPTPSGSLTNVDTTSTSGAKGDNCAATNDKDECKCLERVDYKRRLHDSEKSPDSPRLKDDPTCVYIFGEWHLIWNETRLILIVILSGFLGALVYSLRSFFWYTGNRELKWSWLLMYLLVPIVGAMLAVIFYMLLRGGLFSPTTTVADTSPFGFAAIAALVGMFTNQASEKLRSVFETLMTKPATGRDASTVVPPTITSISPSTVPPGADTLLTVKGTGFTQTSVVTAGNKDLKPATVSANELTVTIPAAVTTNTPSFKLAVSTPGAGKSSEVSVAVLSSPSPPA
ncbi:MAG TPA: IPT/TIG domain-containing protein [Thermoanaerobaculia bacterium]